MPLQTPPTPTYGPDTFEELAQLALILRENDDFLKGLIDGLTPAAPTKTALTLATGYTHHSTYEPTAVLLTGKLATLEGGVINCPASFTAATYFTLGTVPVESTPKGSKHRMGTGLIFTTAGFVPIQYRINVNRDINFYSQVAVSGATYIILSPINWEVV